MAPEVRSLGIRPYSEVLGLQRALQRTLIEGTGPEVIIACQHPPVITIGRGGKSTNIIAATHELAAAGIDRVEVERGGDVTYHGPGQIIVYPILNLNNYRRDVGWYMRLLEESVIQTVARWGVQANRYPGRTGVWLPPRESGARWRKLSSQGVRISRWCTFHGLSLNVTDQQDGFRHLNPCGYTDIDSTSLEQLLGASTAPSVVEVEPQLITTLLKLLEESSSPQSPVR